MTSEAGPSVTLQLSFLENGPFDLRCFFSAISLHGIFGSWKLTRLADPLHGQFLSHTAYLPLPHRAWTMNSVFVPSMVKKANSDIGVYGHSSSRYLPMCVLTRFLSIMYVHAKPFRRKSFILVS